jgi:hypothetical protein
MRVIKDMVDELGSIKTQTGINIDRIARSPLSMASRIATRTWITLLLLSLIGCATAQVYDGPQQPESTLARLKLDSSKLPDLCHAYMITLDKKSDPQWDVTSKGSLLYSRTFEVLPGQHTVEVGLACTSRYLKPYGSTKLELSVEGGHEYILRLHHTDDRRGYYGLHLRLEVIDSTTGRITGDVVDPPKRDPIPFSLSKIPKDKAVVCFYREWKFLSAIGDFYVSESHQAIDTLANGSLFYHVTSPGLHTYSISFGGFSPVNREHVNLMPGAISYLRASVYDGKLTLVQETEALKEISGLKGVK